MGGQISQDLKKPSTSKFILTDKNFCHIEDEILVYTGIPRSEIVIKKVKVGEFDQEDVFMHSIIVGSNKFASIRKQSKPIMVLIHGFAASGACYYSLFKPLSEHFVVITLDLVGMGQSSRPNNFQKHKFTH